MEIFKGGGFTYMISFKPNFLLKLNPQLPSPWKLGFLYINFSISNSLGLCSNKQAKGTGLHISTLCVGNKILAIFRFYTRQQVHEFVSSTWGPLCLVTLCLFYIVIVSKAMNSLKKTMRFAFHSFYGLSLL